MRKNKTVYSINKLIMYFLLEISAGHFKTEDLKIFELWESIAEILTQEMCMRLKDANIGKAAHF